MQIDIDWLVIFDDPEKGYASFEDEVQAREFFEKASVSWTCHLFCRAKLLDAERRRRQDIVLDSVKKEIGEEENIG